MRRSAFLPFTLFTLLLLAACGRREVPSEARQLDHQPHIVPDYTEVTVPRNLCPINFGVQETVDEVVCRLSTGNLQYTYGDGRTVEIDAKEWEELKAQALAGEFGISGTQEFGISGTREFGISGNQELGEILVEVWGRKREKWVAFQPFKVYVAPDEIDPYLSYRLIEPSYVGYEEMAIEQRNLNNFETQTIYNNMKLTSERQGQCVNCHSYQNYGKGLAEGEGRMLFHIRLDWGGTMIVDRGKLTKVNLKTPSTISAGVYPAWHPTEPLIAFSTNKTAQIMHSVDSAKVEVMDAASDLILYDITTNEVTTIAATDSLECFPTWSPDGEWLYFTSASTAMFDPRNPDPGDEAVLHYDEVRYDICRKHFDRATRTFGPTETVYAASADSLSATLPRISPDGSQLVFALGRYGVFHVWHPDADIATLAIPSTDAADSCWSKPQPVDAINSSCSESYPSFSSNGRWLMCASRRDDNNYTRPYIAYYDMQGVYHKPFEVPQRSPWFYGICTKSFNRPEFMAEPVKVSFNEFAKASLRNALQAKE